MEDINLWAGWATWAPYSILPLPSRAVWGLGALPAQVAQNRDKANFWSLKWQ